MTSGEVTPGNIFTAMDIQSGNMLAGRYRVWKEIGHGGFSTVYWGRELGGYRCRVAIKRIQLSALTPREIIDATETFNREVAALSRFKGTKGIPQLYEYFTDAENWYLILEYIDGQTLEDYLQKAGYLREKEVIRIGIAVARIVQQLHAANPPVIFRDLKPANIMITPDHDLFLIDFGIARVFTPGKKRDTIPLGSPAYASPEHYGRAQTDQRSDVYSLGATLQTLLTGRDTLELAAGEASRNRRRPSRAMRKLLADMLSPDAARRPPDMIQVQRRLKNIPPVPLIPHTFYGHARDFLRQVNNFAHNGIQVDLK
jgi:serine/threonine protein kinase